jgi:hypothetical protein
MMTMLVGRVIKNNGSFSVQKDETKEKKNVEKMRGRAKNKNRTNARS